jgi:hypothetical protein
MRSANGATIAESGVGLPSSLTITSNASRGTVWEANASRQRDRLAGRPCVGTTTDTVGVAAFAGRSSVGRSVGDAVKSIQRVVRRSRLLGLIQTPGRERAVCRSEP